MKYGLENDKFFMEFTPVGHPVGNMREVSNKRAVEIGNTSSKIILSFSSGTDCQCTFLSFREQDIPIETVFFYMPGCNDIEYEQLKLVDKKFGINTQIIDLDPEKFRNEIEQWSVELDIPFKNPLIQRKFLSLLPTDCDFIQHMGGDPVLYVSKDNTCNLFYGYYDPEISRQRAFASLNRQGKNIFWRATEEFYLSVLGDDIFRAAVCSAKYFDGNGLHKFGTMLKSVDRWDYYIKPIVYGKYWKDDIIYFPKIAGNESASLSWSRDNIKARQNSLNIPYYDLINFLESNGKSKRFYAK